jgi:murein L,D-transpeptidase YafK
MPRIVMIMSGIILVGLGVWYGWPMIQTCISPEVDLTKVRSTYQEFLATHDRSDPIRDVNIVVTKSNRMIYLMSGDQNIERWSIALGPNPEGTKTEGGDGRTPVGDYYIADRDRRSEHHLALLISYPSRQDADAGLRDEVIDDRLHQEIYRKITQGRLPPQDTPLGGDVSIHGGGTTRDWTNGTIAVDQDVIEILWFACPDSTPMSIYEEFTDWELSDTMLSY